jgi:hypothetical protein
MKTEKKTGKNKPENVLSYYNEENSRNENSARENAGAELDVCTGSSDAAWNPTDGWSKNGCDFEKIADSRDSVIRQERG